MKFIYIVTWLLTEVIPIPCPNNYTEDEFGNRTMKSHQTLQACYDFRGVPKQKWFDRRDSAMAFISRGKLRGLEFKLDSTINDPTRTDSTRIIIK